MHEGTCAPRAGPSLTVVDLSSVLLCFFQQISQVRVTAAKPMALALMSRGRDTWYVMCSVPASQAGRSTPFSHNAKENGKDGGATLWSSVQLWAPSSFAPYYIVAGLPGFPGHLYTDTSRILRVLQQAGSLSGCCDHIVTAQWPSAACLCQPQTQLSPPALPILLPGGILDLASSRVTAVIILG